MFLGGEVDNLLGQVTIYNAFGSVVQLANINANQVDISAPNGALVIDNPTGTEVTGTSPYTAFAPDMIWPGGDPATQAVLNPVLAAAYVANALYNTNGQYGTDSTNSTDNKNFTAALIGSVGQTPGPGLIPITVNGYIAIGNSTLVPGNSLVYFGTNYVLNLKGQITAGGSTAAQANSESPVGTSYQMDQKTKSLSTYFPTVPVEPLSTYTETFTGKLKTTSPTVSITGVTTGLVDGEPISGPNIQPGTTIQSLNVSTRTFTGHLSSEGDAANANNNTLGVSSKSGLALGDSVTGPGIPTGTTITAISSSSNTITISANVLTDFPTNGESLTASQITSITLSANPTANVPNGEILTADAPPTTPSPETFTGTLKQGSNAITAPSTIAGLAVGETVSGPGIPYGTTIQTLSTMPFTGSIDLSSDYNIDVNQSTWNSLVEGETVTGFGIQPGTTIVGLDQFVFSSSGPTYEVTLSTTPQFSGNWIFTATELTLSAAATIDGTESLTTGSSAINAGSVIINAGIIDVDSMINVGEPNNWSVNLPSSLTGTIQADQGEYNSSPVPFTGTLTNGSNSITSPSTTTGLLVGDVVIGAGIPTGTTIQALTTTTFSGSVSSANTIQVSASDQALLFVGDTVTGMGIQPGTTIQALTEIGFTGGGGGVSTYFVVLSTNPQFSGSESLTATHFTLSAAATISGTEIFTAQAPSLYALPVSLFSAGDQQITAQYNAATNKIILNNVNASSGPGFLSLDGAIISTNLSGMINVNTGNGQVTIDNATGIPVVVNNVNAASGTPNPSPSMVDITDTLLPAATNQTLYVYSSGGSIETYRGTSSQTVQQLEAGSPVSNPNGTTSSSTSYSPVSGEGFQWTVQAVLTQTLTQNVTPDGLGNDTTTYSTDGWQFVNPNDPWSSPEGQGLVRSLGSNAPAFQETVSATMQNWEGAFTAAYNGAGGFAPQQPSASVTVNNKKYTEDPWAYWFATDATLYLTDTIKADNPIAINFLGAAQSSVNIASNAPVILAGNVGNSNGNTTIFAPSIYQSSPSATITTGNLSLITTSGGVGSLAQPLSASLTTGGVPSVLATGSSGVYINLDSGALLGNVSSSGGGDVVIDATGNLTRASAGNPILANNITLASTNGTIGTAAAPLELLADGVVNANADGDINLEQTAGNLEVGQIISKSGDVTIKVDSGQILDANQTTSAQTGSITETNTIAQSLNLTNPTAAVNQTVTAFDNQVDAHYAGYWQLLDNGSVQNGILTLNAAGLAAYGAAAAVALNITAPAVVTDDEVQTYANNQYQADVNFFNLNLGSNWMTLPEFQTQYHSYWQLLNNGSVQNGVYTLNADAVSLYSGQAGIPPGVTFTGTLTNGSNSVTGISDTTGLFVGEDVTGAGIPAGTTILSIDSSTGTITLSASVPVNETSVEESLSAAASPAQVAAMVQTYVESLYQSDVTFFANNYGSSWMTLPVFVADFTYQATPDQVTALTMGAVWNTAQLTDEAPLVGLDPVDGSPVGYATPNISGKNVTLTASGSGGSIGQTATPVTIPLADLQTETPTNLTQAQITALEEATAPGSLVITPNGLLVTPTTQVLISATGTLNMTTGGSITIQGTSPNLTLGNVTGGAR